MVESSDCACEIVSSAWETRSAAVARSASECQDTKATTTAAKNAAAKPAKVPSGRANNPRVRRVARGGNPVTGAAEEEDGRC